MADGPKPAVPPSVRPARVPTKRRGFGRITAIFFNPRVVSAPVRTRRDVPRAVEPPEVTTVTVDAPATRPKSMPPRPVPSPLTAKQQGEAPLPAARDSDCPHRLRDHLSPVALVRPEWHSCTSLQHKANGVAVLLGVVMGGSWLASYFSAVALGVSGLQRHFTTPDADMSLLLFAVLALVYAPLAEEAVFRWPISQRPRSLLLLPGICVAVAAAIGILGPHRGLWAHVALDLTTLGAAIGLHRLSVRIRALNAVERCVDRLWQRFPPAPIWLLIVCFALAHLARFEIQWSLAAVAAVPTVVLPWLVFGMAVTIARINLGWWSGVILHAVANLVSIFLVPF